MRPRLATPGNILYNREKIILREEGRREKGITRMKKIGLLLALLALLMAALPGALAETVTYLDEKGEEQTTEAIVLDPTKLPIASTNLGANGETTWYYVPKGTSVNWGNRFCLIFGDVHLILGDGATLTADDSGIMLYANSTLNPDTSTVTTLTIYAQSQGKNMGKLIAKATNSGFSHYPGIGVTQTGILTINGGYIEATGGYDGGAGIGGRGRVSEFEDCGTVIINGGIVTAQGGTLNGVGIGGGSPKYFITGQEKKGGDGGIVKINGGLVTAIGGGDYGRAIGGGSGAVESDNGTLTLGNRIAVYDDSAKDEQLKDTDTATIFEQIIGTFGETDQIKRVLFETHNDYGIVASDKYALPTGKLSMTADGEFGDFRYLRLDNKKLPDTAYTTQPGSTVATVNLSGRNLSPDTTHTLSFIYPNGSADGEFTVVLQLPTPAPTPTPTPAADLSQVPQTGDRSSLLLWAALAVACGVVVIAVVARKRSK